MSIPRLDPGAPAELPSASETDGLHTALIKQLAGEIFSGQLSTPQVPSPLSPFPAVHPEGPAPSLPSAPAGFAPSAPTEPAAAPAVTPGLTTALPAGVTHFSEVPAEGSGGTATLPREPSDASLPAEGQPADPVPESSSAPTITSTPSVSQVTPQVAGAPAPVPSNQAPVHPPTVGEAPSSGDPLSPSSGGHNPNAADTFAYGEPRSTGLLSSTQVAPATKAAPRETSTPHYQAEPGPEFYFLSAPAPRGNPALSSDVPRRSATPISAFDVEAVRRDFPILQQEINGRPLIFLDNAATTQKPWDVINATSNFYARDNSNIHRAAYQLAERATAAFEHGREKVREFLGAADKHEIVFVRGTTEGINLVAQSYGKKFIGSGDEIILSELEHHANIVPWQLLAEQVGAVIRVIPINDRGELILDEFAKLLNSRTKIVSVAHVSNSLGTINPVETIIQLAHAHGVPVLVDGAQSTPHLPVNVQALDADFYVFSGHKVFGPTGIGALYGKPHLLEAMPPYQGGGHMIKDVRFERTIFQNAPEKFEAGTPDIAGVVGLGAAIEYLFKIGIPSIAAYEHSLLEYAAPLLAAVPGLRPIGTAAAKASVLAFVIPSIPNESIAKHLDKNGIAVRAGHHCALPAVRHFGLESTVRPSLAFYNTREEVDALVHALHRLPRT